MSRRRHWSAVAERGSIAGMRLTVWIHRRFGQRLTTLFVLPIVVYFFVTDARGRRASRRYLQRLATWAGPESPVPRPPRLRHAFRHYWEFALSILDRLSLWSGRGEGFDIRFHGRDHFSTLIEAKRGAILLGAHLGSFDVLRALGAQCAVRVNVLMSRAHASRINAVLRELDPGVDLHVIEFQPGSSGPLFAMKACLERGEFVAILADRVGAAPRARSVPVRFLGHPAAFPAGPFVLASRLGCPVLLVVALRRGPRAYEVFAEPFTDRVERRRGTRTGGLDEVVEAYARRLEGYCLRAPYQWFNFHDVWDGEGA
jgi:predicted LPLAT superfamily acyltransferase